MLPALSPARQTRAPPVRCRPARVLILPRHAAPCHAPASSQATFFALSVSYGYLSPDLWKETQFLRSPYQEYSDLLAKTAKVAFEK